MNMKGGVGKDSVPNGMHTPCDAHGLHLWGAEPPTVAEALCEYACEHAGQCATEKRIRAVCCFDGNQPGGCKSQ